MLDNSVLKLVGTETRDWPQIMAMIEEILQAAVELGKSVWAINAAEPGPEDGAIPLGWEKSPKEQVLDFLLRHEDRSVQKPTPPELDNDQIKNLVQDLLPSLLQSALQKELKLEGDFSESWNHLKDTVTGLQHTVKQLVITLILNQIFNERSGCQRDSGQTRLGKNDVAKHQHHKTRSRGSSHRVGTRGYGTGFPCTRTECRTSGQNDRLLESQGQ